MMLFHQILTSSTKSFSSRRHGIGIFSYLTTNVNFWGFWSFLANLHHKKNWSQEDLLIRIDKQNAVPPHFLSKWNVRAVGSCSFDESNHTCIPDLGGMPTFGLPKVSSGTPQKGFHRSTTQDGSYLKGSHLWSTPAQHLVLSSRLLGITTWFLDVLGFSWTNDRNVKTYTNFPPLCIHIHIIHMHMYIYIYICIFFPNKNTQNGWYYVFPDISSWVFLRYHLFMQSCVLQKSNVHLENQPAKGWLEPF